MDLGLINKPPGLPSPEVMNYAIQAEKNPAANRQEKSGIENKVRQFILNNFVRDKGLVLANNTSLIDEALIDSTGVLEIAAFIEEVFGIRTEDEEMVLDNFESVNALCKYIQSKQARFISLNRETQ
jgi:acyl carrier protein